MSDLTNVKRGPNLWPPKVKEAGSLRLEPLLTPDELRQFHLFGIPLMASAPDPVTKKFEVMSDPLLESYIRRAVADVEALTGLTILPIEVEERLPFDRFAWDAFGHMRVSQRPVWAVKKLTVQPSTQQDIFEFPNEWIETGHLYKGLIHVMPFMVGATGSGITVPAGSGTGLPWLASMTNKFWVPAWFTVVYEAGFPDGMVPIIVNELIGTTASMNILSQLAATNARMQSVSISFDGLSQSVGNPGPDMYRTRLEELKNRRDELMGRIKTILGTKFLVGSI